LVDVQDFYAALVESSDDAIAAQDLNGTVIARDPGAERLFGYSASEIVGQSIRKLLPPEKHEEEDILLAGSAPASGSPRSSPHAYTSPAGWST